MKKYFSMTVLAVVVIAGSSALAQSQSMSLNSGTTSNQSFIKSSETANIAATSRSQALITDSIFYSLPHEDMTYMVLGAFNQRQKLRRTTYSFDTETSDQTSNNQAFFFQHSRGITEDIALDFNLDYFMRDESAFGRSTGVNEVLFGARSHFEAMGMNWVYGGNLTYLPDGEFLDKSSKVTAAAKIGFEEAVDIARWGLQFEASTKDSFYFQNQTNLVAFFELPFVKNFNVGVTAGADLTKVSANEQNNFAAAYGQWNIDSVSAAQLNVKQTNQKKYDNSLTESEVGLALNRVF